MVTILEIIGEIIACWIFYALVSLIFKHKVGLVFLIIFLVLDLIPVHAGVQNPNMLISIAICFCLVYFIKFFQIRNISIKKGKK